MVDKDDSIGIETRAAFEERIVSSLWRHTEENYYRPPEEMPFHNTEHFSFVHDRTVEYCDYVEQHGKKPDRFALRLAAILHDAGYYENLDEVNARLIRDGLIDKPLGSKEAYSAWIAEDILGSYQVDPATISRVKRMIMATNVNNIPRTLNEKILVRADLDNISGPKRPFVMNTLRLVREDEILNGPKNPFEQIAFLHSILTTYTQKDLCFGDFDRDIYNRLFKNPAQRNIARISADSIRTTIRQLGSVAFNIAPGLRDFFTSPARVE